MWQSLEAALAQDTKDHEGLLITRLHNLKKISLSIPEYLSKMKGICNELATIQSMSLMMIKLVGWPLALVQQ